MFEVMLEVMLGVCALALFFAVTGFKGSSLPHVWAARGLRCEGVKNDCGCEWCHADNA